MRFLLVLLLTATVVAQDDPVARARALATAGQRAEALQILEARLTSNPEDLDARTLYGTVLSWDGQYDRAREELQRVLAADPDNADARAALANVERWSRAQPNRSRGEVTLGYNTEELQGDNWRELQGTLRLGMFVGRVSSAERGSLDDQQFEMEAYPRFGRRAYAYLGIGFADGTLYPDWRASAEWFQGFGDGFEASAGYRRLAFDEDVDLFTASLGKYAGNWLFQGRVYIPEDDWAYQALARRYFGDEGSYAGVRAGTAREEIRSGVDVIALEHDEVVAEGLYVLRSRWVLGGRAGVTGEGFIAGVSAGMRWR